MKYEVIIIGGSYAGMAAAMALGRALRKTLVIDSGKPCNRYTPQAHNLITHDGRPPIALAAMAKEQVLLYDTVSWEKGEAVKLDPVPDGFRVKTLSGAVFTAEKVLLATGITDLLPDIPGFEACWGISVLHCPYCHGYEMRGKETGILMNGEPAFEFGKMIRQWTGKLSVFTNGPSLIPAAQQAMLKERGIAVVDKKISVIDHREGNIQQLIFDDGTAHQLDALYAKVAFRQQAVLGPETGCVLTPEGLIQVDERQRTSVPGLYAAGDNSSMFRSLSVVIGAGNIAGAMLNREITDASFAAG